MFDTNKNFIPSYAAYRRRETSTTKIGDLLLGSNYPIRIQSMTTTDTMDTKASVKQIIKLIDAGCELVRLTAPSINEAKNLDVIKKELHKMGYKIPLVADIHFTPNAAEVAARIVEKVRINPGNYADKKKFDLIEYSDNDYKIELERIREKFTPLVKICKEYGTAMRIGTNHGSLSDRIMSRYGDSPMGMVESAMEFLRICEDEGFYNIVLSMKSSNTQVMVEAYRLLVATMNKNGMNYPVHLGVTEAGDGDDGRIKSAIGIGTLLADGIGDTIRVSLTEDPEFEIPVAKKLVQQFNFNHQTELNEFNKPNWWSPFEYKKRTTTEYINLGGNQVPRVIANFANQPLKIPLDLANLGHVFDEKLDKWHMTDQGCDYIYLGNHLAPFMLPNGLKAIYDFNTWSTLANKQHAFPAFLPDEFLSSSVFSTQINFLQLNTNELNAELITKLNQQPKTVLVVNSKSPMLFKDWRNFFFQLEAEQLSNPVIIASQFNNPDLESFMLSSSAALGGLLIDGFVDGLMISYKPEFMLRCNQIVFGILQASRARISKTEYISCPSCGRTLFDLQETTALIRKQTDHLKGVKIAIMGCIVNGPGEMADADYGYVGSGVGKITLYRGKEIVKKGIEKETAVAELIELIKADGNWLEKHSSV